MDVVMDDTEAQLVTYLQNILKCQIIPMEFNDLRDLVDEAPRKLKLYKFVREFYPGDRFLDFLRKYPDIFTVNANRTVVLGSNHFTQADIAFGRDCDEVDGNDNEEYISNPSESESESEAEEEGDKEVDRRSTVSTSESESKDSSDENGGSSSSIPDSSLRDNAPTSDSDASSLSSRSSVDCHGVQ